MEGVGIGKIARFVIYLQGQMKTILRFLLISNQKTSDSDGETRMFRPRNDHVEDTYDHVRERNAQMHGRDRDRDVLKTKNNAKVNVNG